MKNLDELIEWLEFGLEKSESEEWTALTIRADKDGWKLLEDLKAVKELRDAHIANIRNEVRP